MSIAKLKIGKLFLGEVDGETEAQREGFDELFYVQDDTYDQLLDGEKFLIIGRKGTGKTILANYLKRKIDLRGGNNYCYIKGANDLNLYKLIKLGESDIDREQGELAWEYILYSMLADIVIEKHNISKHIFWSPINKLKKFMNNDANNFRLVEMSTSEVIENTNNVKAKDIALSGKMGFTTNIKYELKKYYEKLSGLKKILDRALINNNITIIIDDLDSLKVSDKMDINYIQCIANLINAVKRINIKLSQISNSKSKIIILLRDDIYKYLNDNDTNINKIVSNKSFEINWWRGIKEKSSKKESYEHPLIQMVLLKIKKSTPAYEHLTDEELYRLIFPSYVKNKPLIDYLLDYSFGRPRDIIQFLNIIKDKDRESKSFKKNAFQYYLKDYSYAFYRELRNEISIHENADMIKDSIKMIRDLKRINFDLETIKQHYHDNKENYVNIVDIKESLSVLYKLGIIGNSWEVYKRNGKIKYHVSWSYREDSETEPNFSKTFTVHQALWKSLALQNC